MGERDSYTHGTFSWVDNATTDQGGAKAFYADLFGWDYDDRPVNEGVVYTMAMRDGRAVAAITPQMQDEREMGVPPHWNSYVTVDDVDAVAGHVDALGGRLHAQPFDVMDAGRMCVISDPTGAVLCLWQAKDNPGAGLVNAPGAFCWNELATPDPEQAQAFFSQLLGWRFEELPIPGMRLWSIRNGERGNGSIREDKQMQPHWLVYFAVESIDDTAAKAGESGGQVVVPKTDAGGANKFAVLRDPIGAAFGVFEGELDD